MPPGHTSVTGWFLSEVPTPHARNMPRRGHVMPMVRSRSKMRIGERPSPAHIEENIITGPVFASASVTTGEGFTECRKLPKYLASALYKL